VATSPVDPGCQLHGPAALATGPDSGGWTKAQKAHFGGGGIFDKISSN
jgi:ABC-type sulfate transport system substrate-binding protein